MGIHPWRQVVVALVLLTACPARAGGTLAFSGLLPMLRQKPRLSGFLFQASRLPTTAFAEVRLASDFTQLGGRRLGPYVFVASCRTPPQSVLC